MPSILELCEKYYGTRDVYQLMGISKDALVKDGMHVVVVFILKPPRLLYTNPEMDYLFNS